jgi:hypothetical protein
MQRYLLGLGLAISHYEVVLHGVREVILLHVVLLESVQGFVYDTYTAARVAEIMRKSLSS